MKYLKSIITPAVLLGAIVSIMIFAPVPASAGNTITRNISAGAFLFMFNGDFTTTVSVNAFSGTQSVPPKTEIDASFVQFFITTPDGTTSDTITLPPGALDINFGTGRATLNINLPCGPALVDWDASLSPLVTSDRSIQRGIISNGERINLRVNTQDVFNVTGTVCGINLSGLTIGAGFLQNNKAIIVQK
jgi:hypothetical protein